MFKNIEDPKREAKYFGNSPELLLSFPYLLKVFFRLVKEIKFQYKMLFIN